MAGGNSLYVSAGLQLVRKTGATNRAQGPALLPVPTESAERCRDKHSCLSLGAMNRTPTSLTAGIRFH